MGAAALERQRVGISSALLMAESLLRVLVTAGVSFWIAHELGPARFGLLNFASALMVMFYGASTLGLDVPLVLRLMHSSRPGAVLGSALALRVPAALLALLAACALAVVLQHDDREALVVSLIVSLAIVGYAPSVFDAWFKARIEAAPPAAVRLVASLASAAAKIACLAFGFGLEALAWTVVFEAFATSLLIAWAWWRQARGVVLDPLRPDPVLMRQLWRESWPYFGSHVATLLSMKLDVVMLGALALHEQTGLYSLSQKLSEVLYLVPVALIESALPMLARRRLDSQDEAAAQTLFDVCAAASIVTALLGVWLAGPAVVALFGEAYAQSLPLFHWQAWTVVAVGLAMARHRWLAVVGLQRHAPALAITTAAIGIALNLVLVPRFGAMGAVCSALLSQFAGGLLLSFAFPDLRGIARMQIRSLWPWGRLLHSVPGWLGRKVAP